MKEGHEEPGGDFSRGQMAEKPKAESQQNLLVSIDRITQELATMDSKLAKQTWNKADAIRQLAQAANNFEVHNKATVVKIRCEIRLAETLRDLKESGELSEGQPRTVEGGRQYLADLGISRDMSSRVQKLLAAPVDKREQVLAEVWAEKEHFVYQRTIVQQLVGQTPPESEKRNRGPRDPDPDQLFRQLREWRPTIIKLTDHYNNIARKKKEMLRDRAGFDKLNWEQYRSETVRLVTAATRVVRIYRRSRIKPKPKSKE